MTDINQNKQIVQDFIQVVWKGQNLDALKDFWTQDCINHAMPSSDNCGLEALKVYHEPFLASFSAFSEIEMKIVQQIAERDRVTTYIITQGQHSGTFYGISPTGKSILTSAIRIDRMQNGKIAEHWSVTDAAGVVQQLQS